MLTYQLLQAWWIFNGDNCISEKWILCEFFHDDSQFLMWQNDCESLIVLILGSQLSKISKYQSSVSRIALWWCSLSLSCLLITLISNIDQTHPGEQKGKLRWQPIVSGIIGVGLVSVLCSSILVSGLWSTFPNFQSGFPLNFQFLHPHYYSASFLNMASLSVSHALYALTIPARTIAALFFPFRSLSQTQNLVYIRFWHFYRDRL